MQRTNIFLTDEQQKRLQHRAAEEGISKSRLIRRILDDALGVTHVTAPVEEVVRATSGIWSDRTDEEIHEVLAWRSEDPLERLAR